MRLLLTTANDMRYQMKYGFYFLYTFISILYIAILIALPENYKILGASIILLTDPSMLGFFFIGGIWLLEKEEGVHKFYGISPLRPMEYIFAKVLSLAIISTLSSFFIVLFGIKSLVKYPLMIISIFIGSCIFTMLGLTIATFARSVNNYMLIGSPVGIVFVSPAILAAFQITHPVLEILPGTVLWRLINISLNGQSGNEVWILLIELIIWLLISTLIAMLRVPAVLQSDGGERKHETNS